MYYVLPAFDANNNALTDPTGQYSFTMRAYDRAGNVFTSSPVQIRIDQSAPANTLTTPPNIAAQTVIGQQITIGGAVAENGTIKTGIASSEIAFTPQSVTNVLGSPLLLMPLDDAPGAARSTTTRATASQALAAAPARSPVRLGASAAPPASTPRRRRRSRLRQ